MSLSPDQKRYATGRVKTALKEKLDKIREKHTKKGKAEPTDKKKLDALWNGDVPLRRGVTLKESLAKAYDFSSLENGDHFDEEGYAREAGPLKEEADKVLDAVMLGEQSEAVEMVKKFCG